MALNSVNYMLFLALGAAVHAALPGKWRNLFLLVLGMGFCLAGSPWSLLVCLCAALMTFYGGRALYAARSKRLLTLLCALLLLNLCFFKYANIWARFLADPVSVLLPLGISFYTFEALSYLIDIYHGKLQPEEDLLSWLCGVFFFPKFSSGPITRMQQLLPQLHQRQVTLSLVTEGLRRILLGAMAKVVLADGIAVLVNGFYGDMAAHSSLAVLLAVFLYPLQLYFDFVGYSGMAIGSALLFGIRLDENFKAPYFASSIGEFWSRWHISLSEWFRDYVYFPLGGSRCSALRAALNLLAVFALSGIWHGSTANYLLWGLLLGLARILERQLQLRRGSKDALPLGRVYTLGVWTLSLVFFRLPSLNQVRQLIDSVLRPVSLSSFVPDLLNTAASDIAYSGTYFLIYFGSIFTGILIQVWFDYKMDRSLRSRGASPCTDPLAELCPCLRWALYWLIGFITAAMYLITQTSASPSFIYAGY